MQVSVESTGTIGRRLTIAVPAERLEKAVSTRLARLSRQVKMPGFRKGKIPLKMIEAQYGDQVLDEAASELIRSTLIEALEQESLKPAGQAQKIEPKRLQRGAEFEYIVELEVYPEVQKRDLFGCTMERPVVEITDEDVDRTIETIRKQRSSWSSVEREAKEGDQLVADFVGKLDGEPFEGGSASRTPIVLGSKSLIAGFEDGLLGARAGDEKTLDLTFPQDYGNQELAGKAVQFEVTVHEVQEQQLPEIDAEFIKQMGVENGEIGAFHEEVKGNLGSEKEQRIRDYLRLQVEDALIEGNPVEIPKSLLDAEINKLQQSYTQGKMDDKLAVSLREVFAKQAGRRVVLGLVLGDIIRDKKLTVDAAKIRARVEEMAAGYESPEQVISWHYADKSRLSGVESMVLEEEIVALLMNDATVKEKKMSFQDLLGISGANPQS